MQGVWVYSRRGIASRFLSACKIPSSEFELITEVKTGLRTYFLNFTNRCSLEIMFKPDLPESGIDGEH